MKKNKGFTLIELLAVIVILAVIALIATPIVMNVINDSKEGAAKDAMYGYVKAVELAAMNQVSATTDAPDGDYVPENGNLKNGSELLEIAFKGTKPANEGTVKISKGNVVKATLVFGEITVTYNGKEAIVGGSTPSPTTSPTVPAKTYTVGEVVYFDPTGAVTDCASGKEWTPSNTGTTCYKWNVIKDNGTTIEMLLDHNTTAKVAWNSSASSSEMKEAKETLQADVATWKDSIKSTARLISANEVAIISGLDSWVQGSAVAMNVPAWLGQNIDRSTSYGYWTSTAYTSSGVYYVSGYLMNGYVDMSDDDADEADSYGIRPVVTISKSVIA